MDHLNYEKCTSNPCEGMNHSIKHSKSSMKANMNLDNSMKSIPEQTCHKNRLRKPDTYNKLVCESVWAHSPTASHITPLAEGILNNEWNQSSDYTIIRCGLCEFKCLLNVPDEDTSNQYIYPIITRIRTITLDGNKISCSCMKWNRCHLACRHIMALLGRLSEAFAGIRWFRHYAYYNNHPDLPQEIQQTYNDPLTRYPETCVLCDSEVQQIKSLSPVNTDINDEYPYIVRSGNRSLEDFSKIESSRLID